MYWIQLTAFKSLNPVRINLKHASQILTVAQGGTNIIFAASTGDDVDFIQVTETPEEILSKEVINVGR
jgi:hypothetical protein